MKLLKKAKKLLNKWTYGLAVIVLGLAVVSAQAADQQICFTIPSAWVDETVECMADRYHYQDEIPDPQSTTGATIPNPQNKGQFAKQVVKGFVKNNVKACRADADTGRQDAIDDVENNLILQ